MRAPRIVSASRHTGHSLADTDSLRPRFAIADRQVETTREVPSCIDEDGRASYLAIARRAQVEAVNLYTVLVLGAQMYQLHRKLKAA